MNSFSFKLGQFAATLVKASSKATDKAVNYTKQVAIPATVKAAKAASLTARIAVRDIKAGYNS